MAKLLIVCWLLGKLNKSTVRLHILKFPVRPGQYPPPKNTFSVVYMAKIMTIFYIKLYLLKEYRIYLNIAFIKIYSTPVTDIIALVK